MICRHYWLFWAMSSPKPVNSPKPINSLIPAWPAPETVGAAITIRSGGCSRAPYNDNNLALHVGDNEFDVEANRQLLASRLGLAEQPLWLQQVHGTEIVYGPNADGTPVADASYSDKAGAACVVMTADCLPVLMCNRQGTRVAAAHAGWRGLCNGILRKTVATFAPDDQLLAYLGPAIGPKAFEVGAEVLQAFQDRAQNPRHMQAIKAAFVPALPGKYLADLYALARAELACSGVDAVYGGDYCTFNDAERFYSYRREPETGRFASLIWLKDSE